MILNVIVIACGLSMLSQAANPLTSLEPRQAGLMRRRDNHNMDQKMTEEPTNTKTRLRARRRQQQQQQRSSINSSLIGSTDSAKDDEPERSPSREQQEKQERQATSSDQGHNLDKRRKQKVIENVDKRASNPVMKSDDDDNLLERSFEVAGEAAVALASVGATPRRVIANKRRNNNSNDGSHNDVSEAHELMTHEELATTKAVESGLMEPSTRTNTTLNTTRVKITQSFPPPPPQHQAQTPRRMSTQRAFLAIHENKAPEFGDSDRNPASRPPMPSSRRRATPLSANDNQSSVAPSSSVSLPAGTVASRKHDQHATGEATDGSISEALTNTQHVDTMAVGSTSDASSHLEGERSKRKIGRLATPSPQAVATGTPASTSTNSMRISETGASSSAKTPHRPKRESIIHEIDQVPRAITSRTPAGPRATYNTPTAVLPKVSLRSSPIESTRSKSPWNNRPIEGQENESDGMAGIMGMGPSGMIFSSPSKIQPILEMAEEEETEESGNREGNGPAEVTIEELEPLVESGPVDAGTLRDQGFVVLKGHALNRTMCALRSPEDESILATLEGLCLGKSHEILKLSVLTSSSIEGKQLLRYGGRVALRSPCSNDYALGVRQVSNCGSTRFQVGFFRSVTTREEQWMVLRGDVVGGVLRLGKAATRNVVRKQGLTAPVHSGDSIILRNCQTGGVLTSSDGDRGELRLLVDSHDLDRVRHGVAADPSLIGRLQRHDILAPLDSEIFHLLPSTSPPSPFWVSGSVLDRRPYLAGSYLRICGRHANASWPTKHGGSILQDTVWLKETRVRQLESPLGQESLLLDELLGSLLGLEGEYIMIEVEKPSEEIHFHLVDKTEFSVDPILRHFVEEMLPLSNSYLRIREFLAKHRPGYEYGAVMQALSAEVDRILQEYIAFVASLQREYRPASGTRLTVRSLHVRVRSSIRTMSVLERAVATVHGRKGGKAINHLAALQLSYYDGDEIADNIFERLLVASASPYLETLHRWLKCGILSDPYEEFMIECKDTINWEERYAIVAENVLDRFFSTKSTIDRVLAAGRYWNAVSACHASDYTISEKLSKVGLKPLLRWTSTVSTVSTYVEDNYQNASRVLLQLLMVDYDLIGSLRFMKRYFLLDHGDFFVNFLDAAEEELAKELANVSRGRTQNCLNVSLQLSESHQEDGGMVSAHVSWDDGGYLCPDSIRVRFALQSLADHLDQLHAASGGLDINEPMTPSRHAYGGKSSTDMTGLDAFVIDVSYIPFPVSLVISQRALSCYQLLFRHLFFAKYVERRLVSVWQDHQALKELQSIRGSMGATFLLRQRMLHFVQNLIYYMMFEVIEPNWLELHAAIDITKHTDHGRSGQTVDDILRLHSLFLRRVLEACLLTNRDLIRALTKLMKTCLLFSDQMKRFMTATRIRDDQRAVSIAKQKMAQQNLHDRNCSHSSSIDPDNLQQRIQEGLNERWERVQRQTRRTQKEIASDSYKRMIARFDEVFSDHLREFMQQLTDAEELYRTHRINLCDRLDYNGFMSATLRKNTESE